MVAKSLRCDILLAIFAAYAFCVFFSSHSAAMEEEGQITVYPTGKIITVDRTNPEATAVAVRAITIDAAHHLGLEKDIGTIEPGKLADFTVLDKSPYDVGAKGLRDLKVWGVVFEGRVVKANTQK